MIVGKNFINGQVVADLQSFENHKNLETHKICQLQRKLSKKITKKQWFFVGFVTIFMIFMIFHDFSCIFHDFQIAVSP